MIIEGAVSQFVGATGNNTLNLPESGLTIVGLTIAGNGVLIGVPIDAGHNALFIGYGLGYYFNKIKIDLKSSSFNYTVVENYNAVVTVYYGTPDAGNIPLQAFAGVYESVSISVAASTTEALYSSNVTFDYPQGSTILTTFDLGAVNIPSGVSTNGAFTVTFNTKTGRQMILSLPNIADNTPILGGVVNSPSGLLPINVPASLSVTMSIDIYANNSNTAASTVTAILISYYAYR